MRWMIPLVATIAAALAPLQTSRAGSVAVEDFNLVIFGPNGSPITGTISAMWGTYSAGVFTPLFSATQSSINAGYFDAPNNEFFVALTQSDNTLLAAGTPLFVSIFNVPGGSGSSTWTSTVPQIVLRDPAWIAPTFTRTTPELTWSLGASTVSMLLAQFGGASPTYNFNGGSPQLSFQLPPPPDTTPPVITLIGPNPQTVFRGTAFTDLGATVTDNSNATRTILGSGTVNTSTIGTYTLTYSAQDQVGNVATPVTRTVNVVLNPTGDEDNDGLNNTEEANLGTNPYQRDTDSDGVNDLREVGDATDPLDAASFDSLNQGLVAYYPFNGNAKDESGNGRNGVAVGATPTSDRFDIPNKSYNFNGFSWIETSEYRLLDGATAAAISAWLFLESGQGGQFLSAGDYRGGYDPIHMNLRERNASGTSFSDLVSNDLAGIGAGGGGTNLPQLSASNWHHVVVVLSREDPRGVFSIYVDGRLALQQMATNTFGKISYDRDMRFLIGAIEGRPFYATPGQFWTGKIDDIRIYGRALTANDVALLNANERYSGSGLEGAATKSPFDRATATNWSAGGTEWSVDTSITHDGTDSVKARTTDGQSTYREYTVTGPAVVDFWWKVSSEQIYDTFSYAVNGVNQETISGEVDWTYRALTLPAGTHTIRWTYTKDVSDAIGADAGWMDDLAVYPATPALRVRNGTSLLDGAATVDFGDANVGSSGLTRELTFSNEGYVPMEVELSLPAGSPFTFEGGSYAFSVLLGREESVSVPVYLATQSTGTKTALLSMVAPGSTVPPPQVTLTGDVLRGPVITVLLGGSSVRPGQTIDMGLAPQTLEFTIRNFSSTAVLVPDVSVTSHFRIVQPPAASVAPRSTTTFKVLAQSGGTFGQRTGNVVITSNDGLSPIFTIPLTSRVLLGIENGIIDGTVATSGSGGGVGWGFASTELPTGLMGQAHKTGTTPHNGGSALEMVTQAAGAVSWSWKVSAQENFDWLLCEVDGQEVAGISTKHGVWQSQVVQVPAGAHVRWVYRKDGSGSAGEDAGYLADVAFAPMSGNQSFTEWSAAHGITDPDATLPRTGMKAMFAWLGGADLSAAPDAGHYLPIMEEGRLKYRFPVSKSAGGMQTVQYSSDLSTWTSRRMSQRVISEDGKRMVVEAMAPSGTNGFFRVLGTDNPRMILVEDGVLPSSSQLAGAAVADFEISKAEVTWAEWQAVRNWAISNGYDLAGVGQASGSDHPVRNVNWYDAVKWCNAKSEMEGLAPVYQVNAVTFRAGDFGTTGSSVVTANAGANGYRLPTEVEWEWAARGGASGEGYTYSGSNDLDAVAWYRQNSLGAVVPLTPMGRGTRSVRTKAANELGIYDMNGNTWEWCWDGNSAGGRRIRGGSFINEPFECDLHHRGYIADPLDKGMWPDLGLRVARNVVTGGDAPANLARVQGGTLPQSSGLAGIRVSDFRIGKKEVTWAEWQEIRDWAVANGYSDLADFGGGSGPDHPVRNVNWYDVAKWCNAKSEKENLKPVYLNGGLIYRLGNFYAEPDPSANGYRLPTEAEWEWAARGGTSSQNYIYVGSNDLNAVGWYLENSLGAPLSLSNGRGTWPIGKKQPNELGLYDMSGNVVEWCFDSVNGNGENRRFRGGSWGWTAEYCTVGSRYWFFGTINRASDVGFRLARNAD